MELHARPDAAHEPPIGVAGCAEEQVADPCAGRPSRPGSAPESTASAVTRSVHRRRGPARRSTSINEKPVAGKRLAGAVTMRTMTSAGAGRCRRQATSPRCRHPSGCRGRPRAPRPCRQAARRCCHRGQRARARGRHVRAWGMFTAPTRARNRNVTSRRPEAASRGCEEEPGFRRTDPPGFVRISPPKVPDGPRRRGFGVMSRGEAVMNG